MKRILGWAMIAALLFGIGLAMGNPVRGVVLFFTLAAGIVVWVVAAFSLIAGDEA
jgi:hypothetical protein